MSLDESVDVVVLGTGLTESILAAAIARCGKKVLCLDANEYYGTSFASLGTQELDDNFGARTLEETPLLNDAQKRLPEPHILTTLSKITTPLRVDPSTIHGLCSLPEELKAHSRRFMLDLNPRMTFSRGEEVDLIVRSGIGHYLEFKALEGTYLGINGRGANTIELAAIPCSKKDLFKSKAIPPKERLPILRLLDTFRRKEQWEEVGSSAPATDEASGETPEATFSSYLADCKLSAKLQRFVMYGIAHATLPQGEEGNEVANPMSAAEGQAAMRGYLGALGRFGETAFLVSYYGSGELSQAFCRLSAVHGGVFMLRNTATALVLAPPPTSKQEASTTNQESAVGSLSSEPCAVDKDDAAGSQSCTAVSSEHTPEGASAANATNAAKSGMPSVDRSKSKLIGVTTTNGEYVECRHLIASRDYLPTELLPRVEPCRRSAATDQDEGSQGSPGGAEECPYGVSRAVAVTDRSLVEGQDAIFAVLPPGLMNNRNTVFLFQGSATQAIAPKGYYVVHLTTLSNSPTAHEDLWECMRCLVDTTRTPAIQPDAPVPSDSHTASVSATNTSPSVPPSTQTSTASATTLRHDATSPAKNPNADSTEPQQPRLLWWKPFKLRTWTAGDTGASPVCDGVYVVDDPGLHTTWAHCIQNAYTIFHQICPEEEFLAHFERKEDGQADEFDIPEHLLPTQADTRDEDNEKAAVAPAIKTEGTATGASVEVASEEASTEGLGSETDLTKVSTAAKASVVSCEEPVGEEPASPLRDNTSSSCTPPPEIRSAE
eukprot:Rmarinus@m.13492